MNTIAIYCRVSSRSQDSANQKPDLQRWIDQNPDAPVKWYDDTFTGKTMDRPGWNRLWAAVERGEVKKIVVWRLDRLGRTVSGLSRTFEDLTGRGVTLVSLRDSFDLATTSGRFMANILASV